MVLTADLHPQPEAQMAPKSFNHSTEMKSVQPFQVKKLTQKNTKNAKPKQTHNNANYT